MIKSVGINKVVCHSHFGDSQVKKFIRERGEKSTCSYCNKTVICRDVGELAEFIEKAIRIEYDDPYAQGAPYNPEPTWYEDRFPTANSVSDTRDILYNEVDFVDDGFDADIVTDISSYFSNDYWTKIDGIWGATQSEYMYDGWNNFKSILKHKIRYLFFSNSFSKTFNDEDGFILNPYHMLDEVARVVKKLNLIVKIPRAKLKVYRGRQHYSWEKINTSRELGSPPPNLAKANRMSAAGISTFYGAFDIETCIKEIEDTDWKDSSITIGLFENLTDFNVIDFTKIYKTPSLFDLKKRQHRSIIEFIRSFIRDVSVPIKPDETVHIEYVPTQVVGEYFKYMPYKNGKVNGIIYDSVKNKGRKCIVLFVENNELVDPIKTDRENSDGKLIDSETRENKLLVLLSTSTK